MISCYAVSLFSHVRPLPLEAPADTQTTSPPAQHTHVGMFPVVDNLLHVPNTVEQEVIPPLRPVYCHGAVFVHAGDERVAQFQHKHAHTLASVYKIVLTLYDLGYWD